MSILTIIIILNMSLLYYTVLPYYTFITLYHSTIINDKEIKLIMHVTLYTRTDA